MRPAPEELAIPVWWIRSARSFAGHCHLLLAGLACVIRYVLEPAPLFVGGLFEYEDLGAVEATLGKSSRFDPIGICSNRLVFAVSETEVSFGEFARLFRDKLQCKNALFVDGGAVPSLYSPEIAIYDRAEE
jgi:hypothetical protein